MSPPAIPADFALGGTAPATLRRAPPQASQWQQAMARAHGEARREQSKNTLPGFETAGIAARAAMPRAASAAEPSPALPVARARPGPDGPALPREWSAPRAEHATAQPAASTSSPGALAWMLRAQPAGAATDTDDLNPHPEAAQPSLHDALIHALGPQGGAAPSEVQLHTTLTAQGVEVVLAVRGPLAADIPALRLACLSFFARHGIQVARIELNGRLIESCERPIDRIETLSGKD